MNLFLSLRWGLMDSSLVESTMMTNSCDSIRLEWKWFGEVVRACRKQPRSSQELHSMDTVHQVVSVLIKDAVLAIHQSK